MHKGPMGEWVRGQMGEFVQEGQNRWVVGRLLVSLSQETLSTAEEFRCFTRSGNQTWEKTAE